MTASLLCTTVAAPDCSELARKAGLALSAGSDIVELRIDHLRRPEADQVLGALDLSFESVVPKTSLDAFWG